MQLSNAIAVLGASGKMGKGISALLLQEVAKEVAKGSLESSLVLIDSNRDSFLSSKRYLREQLLKYAEKNINHLRELYFNQKNLISNKEMIDKFVQEGMERVFFSDQLTSAANAEWIFEAIIEDAEKKAEVFSALKSMQSKPAYFFTNTSSIPIHVLEEMSGLKGRVIGFHFYNPPLVQKLVELIIPKDCDKKLIQLGEELLKRLNKSPVVSRDVAGFIGNGYFMQEIIYASKKARELGAIHGMAEGIYLIDTLTREWLLRPMGIFQLMDYVGLDVINRILKIMRLKCEWIDWMLLSGRAGGQAPDGTLKPGFFTYQGEKRGDVFDPEKKVALPIEDFEKAKARLGKEPSLTFKALEKDPEKVKKLESYFYELNRGKTFGDELAKKFLEHSRKVASELVKTGVAKRKEDVDEVLKKGFYHLYGAFEIEAF